MNPSAVTSFLHSILPVVQNIILLPVSKLSPNRITNLLFTDLVNLICSDELTENEISLVLTEKVIISYQPTLMTQCSTAEYYLEFCFAHEMISGNKSINDFIYYHNYESLVQFEMDTLKMYQKNLTIGEVAIIGSGPLPITSVEILKHLPLTVVVTNYDHSEEAVELSKIVVNNNNRIFVKNRTALEMSIEDLHQVDLVYLAALVGTTKMEKKKIIHHLYNVMKPGSILVARTAIGLKTLIYRRTINEDFGNFKNIQEFHPKDKQILNSIILGIR